MAFVVTIVVIHNSAQVFVEIKQVIDIVMLYVYSPAQRNIIATRHKTPFHSK